MIPGRRQESRRLCRTLPAGSPRRCCISSFVLCAVRILSVSPCRILCTGRDTVLWRFRNPALLSCLGLRTGLCPCRHMFSAAECRATVPPSLSAAVLSPVFRLFPRRMSSSPCRDIPSSHTQPCLSACIRLLSMFQVSGVAGCGMGSSGSQSRGYQT